MKFSVVGDDERSSTASYEDHPLMEFGFLRFTIFEFLSDSKKNVERKFDFKM